jgi:hypothetical protein
MQRKTKSEPGIKKAAGHSAIEVIPVSEEALP